ncbi:MAG TPA: nucleotidyltransferase domain-containing protein [Ferruginibacter sp.]|nr:nucleotidyltransferase domain-containing protein [Ferruginibacter sp.]
MQNIQTILTNIEQKKKIKILYACETGSRAWGFPSPDSDYDIRFVYMHERDWYLNLSQRKDTIEIMDGDLDITGWDLRKCLTLLKKSNAPLIERFQSPIEYYSVPGFKDDFKKMIESYYSPIAVFYHHHSLAKKFWEELKDKDEYKLKSLFYLVRSLLSCNWILEDKQVLPMDIFGLMQYATDEQKLKINELIALKATVREKYQHPKDTNVHEWIVAWFEKAEAGKDKLEANKKDIADLNEFFLKMLYATDN